MDDVNSTSSFSTRFKTTCFLDGGKFAVSDVNDFIEELLIEITD